MKRNQFEIIAMASILAAAISMVYFLIEKLDAFGSYYSIFVSSAVSATIALYVSFIFKSLNKNPTPLRVFVIGQPRTGKTVYLSVLFDELQRHSSNNIDFQPYGSETVEKVNSNLQTLNKGSWVPRTEVNTAFYYRARASVGTGIFKNNYTLEVGDYAGEHIEEFNSSSEMWLHKTDYFKYALASDALLFCIDGEILLKEDRNKIESSQAILLAAFQMLLSEKTINAGSKLKLPIGLVVLKSDLFTSEEQLTTLLEEYYYRLRGLINSKAMNYKEFYISSVGETNNGMPPLQLRPKRVVEPFIWLLKNSRV
ncbi:TRAFAC clade GTPase domain-containing protein [Aeromonas salmonicida]|uniref:TRAFAC clade GTPase domain-containing protein n=1 Tax=Aeromonas salmonicida TaxID=645 RepID=UPI003D1D9350